MRRPPADGASRSGAPDEGARRSGPPAPAGARGKPVGVDKARRRDDAPPRRGAAPPPPPRPDLPVDDRPNLPKPVRRDIERTLGPGRRTDEVALALSVGSQAIDEQRVELALEYLAWAKHQAPRVASIREAYGVARYLAEDYAGALTELQAYARISGRNDQQHLVADCHRAVGRGIERVEEAARRLLDDDRAPADRRAEAAIVLAGAYGDVGRPAEGSAILRPLLPSRRGQDDDHHLRVRSLIADLAVQAGDREEARRQLAVLVAVEDDPLDAGVRLAALDGD